MDVVAGAGRVGAGVDSRVSGTACSVMLVAGGPAVVVVVMVVLVVAAVVGVVATNDWVVQSQRKP